MSLAPGNPRIAPFLWFNDNAEQAVRFYTGIFDNSAVLSELRNPPGSPLTQGAILTMSFVLDGQRFTALNGGPAHSFTDAISLVVTCASQQEIDFYWEKLTDGGTEVQCGWLRDRFGVTWQVVPENIGSLLKHPKAIAAMMTMKKLVIADLEAAGRP